MDVSYLPSTFSPLLSIRLCRMEAAGIEPASCDPSDEASTCVFGRLCLAGSGSADRARPGPAHNESRSARSGH